MSTVFRGVGLLILSAWINPLMASVSTSGNTWVRYELLQNMVNESGLCAGNYITTILEKVDECMVLDGSNATSSYMWSLRNQTADSSYSLCYYQDANCGNQSTTQCSSWSPGSCGLNILDYKNENATEYVSTISFTGSVSAGSLRASDFPSIRVVYNGNPGGNKFYNESGGLTQCSPNTTLSHVGNAFRVIEANKCRAVDSVAARLYFEPPQVSCIPDNIMRVTKCNGTVDGLIYESLITSCVNQRFGHYYVRQGPHSLINGCGNVNSTLSSLGLDAANSPFFDDYVTASPTYSRSPTAFPTFAPTPTPSPTNGGDGGSCFHGDSLVELASGEMKPISSVRVGDRVRVALERQELDADTVQTTVGNTRRNFDPLLPKIVRAESNSPVYARVVFVPHPLNERQEEFVDIRTEGGHTLKVTKEHLIPARFCDHPHKGELSTDHGAMHLVRAVDVIESEMCLSTLTRPSGDRITSVRVAEGKGVYTIVTEDPSGYIVVDGVRASSFGVNHFWPNTFYHLHRVGFRWLPSGVLDSSAVISFNNAIGTLSLAAWNLWQL